ncbi:MAG: hypothetical protein LUH03_09805 [Oscillospiraceae bacterium]|nr:hypothetical protein [Oscillospiraceae bacterium]
MEDLQRVCTVLCAALQETDAYHYGLLYLDVRMNGAGQEIVTAFMGNGTHKEINVTGDSGIALMRDVVEALWRDTRW